jgi:SAM-dependent methyltransferase
VRWRSDEELEVDGTTFLLTTGRRVPSSEDRFTLVKPRPLVERYIELLEELAPQRIVELGVFQGGSTALIALLARPQKLLAIELSPDRIPALDQLVATRGLESSVVVHHGIDQSDVDALETILDSEMGAAPLDLVIDDASHEVEPSESSFNVLFPRLRPGGTYVVEDWAWAHLGFGALRPDHEPLTTFVFELIATLPQPRGLIADIHIDRHWAAIRPADGDPHPGTEYDVRRICNDRGRNLVVYLRDRETRREPIGS